MGLFQVYVVKYLQILQRYIPFKFIKMQSVLRIKKEIESLKKEIATKEIISMQILYQDPNYQNVIISFSGPIDSPYQGYWFRIKFEWTQKYPYHPPKCTLLDKIWSPYINFKTNQICLDILKDKYLPCLIIRTIVQSIISLLSENKISEDHKGFMNPEAAIQMMKNYPLFSQYAKQICQISLYKKKFIYSDQMRGLPEEHQIHALQSQIASLILQNEKSRQFNKK